MQSEQIIVDLISEGRYDEAISVLDRNIEEDASNSLWWYLRGKVYWRMQKHTDAISDYEEAVHLDAHSPAVHALEMARDVMNFYNPDLLNP